MSSTQRSNNVAARMGRWSAQHRKKAIFGWLAFAIALFAISITSPMKTIIADTSGPGESGRADTILYNDFKQPAGEEVLIQSRSLTTTDPAFKTAVEAVIAGVSRLDAVVKVKSPYAPGNSGFVSADKHSALVRIEIRGPSEDAVDKIDPIVARVAEVQKANPELYVGSFGESTGKALTASFGDDLKRAGLFSVPLTLIILLIAFGALVAAGIPLLLGLTSVLATLGLVAVIS
ncbi:MAG TPA: MMPL family transporter, partial [Gaiellaceae bacterium]|nr:MMPL family transporter [Gaiellaceae bacterium]